MSPIERLPDARLGEIAPLFAAVFGQTAEAALLDWKYAQGRGQSWVFRGEDGVPLVHCGIAWRSVLLAGEPQRGGQLVDLMAGPKAGGLSRAHSPFAQLLHAVLAQVAAEGGEPALAFGFPSGRAMRLAELCGVATEVGLWRQLTIAPRQSARRGRLRAVHWPLAAALAAADKARLWPRMAKSLPEAVLGVRDAAYLAWRFGQCPGREHVLLGVQSAWLRRTVGLLVLRRQPEHWALLDVLAAWPDVPELLAALADWLGATTPALPALLHLTANFADQLAAVGYRSEATEFRIMGNPLAPPAVLAAQRERWWLTGGDTDYR